MRAGAPHPPRERMTWLSMPVAWSGMSAGLTSAMPVSFDPLMGQLQALFNAQGAKAKNSAQAVNFQKMLAAVDPIRAQRFIAGIKAYQNHPVARDVPEMPVIWERGTTRLRDYNPKAANAPPVLIIPSLINRFTIFDLDADHSLLRLMAAEGLRPLVVDWDEPGEDEQAFALTDYVAQRLFLILDFLSSSGLRPHVLGYCMGGLLALALAILKPGRVRSLSLLATPWHFEGDPAAKNFLELADNLEPFLQERGRLPVDVLQTMFALFQPEYVMEKFARFAGLDSESIEAKRFVLTEDWLNDGVPLTAPVARECLRDWYGENKTGKMQWRIAGQTIDPRALDIPAYVIAAGKDTIVPPASVRPLARLIRRAALHEPVTGHIGLMASHTAPQEVWKPLMRWVLGH